MAAARFNSVGHPPATMVGHPPATIAPRYRINPALVLEDHAARPLCEQLVRTYELAFFAGQLERGQHVSHARRATAGIGGHQPRHHVAIGLRDLRPGRLKLVRIRRQHIRHVFGIRDHWTRCPAARSQWPSAKLFLQ